MQEVPTQTKYGLNRLGIHHINNTVVFVLGNRVIARSPDNNILSNVELTNLSFRMDIDEDLTAKDAFAGMRELISLSPEIGRILVAHTISGIIRAAFKEAGFTPCAVLVIVGKSGMLKSSYVPHLVQLYNRKDEIRAHTRFNSTSCYIEDILQDNSECTTVIDDLHTAEAKEIKKTNEATAEDIIRRVSDDTGRGRKRGNEAVQKNFGGNVVYIGEYSVGKESTIPRSLVVSLTKKINGEILDKHQRKHRLVASIFYYFFVQWYVDHFEMIRSEIDERLTKFRKLTADSAIHGRLNDTQFYLQISYIIFLEFCRESEFISKEDTLDEYDGFAIQLANLIQAQQSRFGLNKEKINYLKLVRKLYKSGSFCIAKTKKQFNPNKHDGLYYYDGCVCLRGESLDKKIRKIIPNAKREDIIKNLRDKNALKLVQEKCTVQIKGGLRFYAIKQEFLD